MFPSPVNNSNSDTTGSDQSTSPLGQTTYAYQCHSQIRNAKYMNYDKINNNKNNLINGKIFPSAPIEFKPAPSNVKMSPFLRGPPMSCVTLDFLQPPPLPPAATASSSSSVATKKKEYVPVSYIRIWTVLYDVYTKIDKCVDVVVLAPHNTKFFQRLIATNIIHITYCENYPILSNMLALLNWTDSCRFFLSARGFCEDFITFLKTLPRINAVCFRDVCSNESIFFDQLLNLLTNADELEIDMRHIKYNEDPGIILMQWKRPPTLKKFILYNLVKGTVSSSAVKQFCKEKVIPGGQINVTYEKYPKQC